MFHTAFSTYTPFSRLHRPQARGNGLAGNQAIQPHGVDGVLPVFLESGAQAAKSLEKREQKSECFD